MEVLSATAHNDIQWKQLWSLAALYGSVVIGWIAYANYQPKLLDRFAMTDFTLALTLAKGLIVVVTPPIAGLLGDKYRFEKGHRLPVISAGMSFAAMIFMAVAFTLFTNPGETFKWILPFLIVCWLVSMSIFTSPALSTVELFTPVDKLPRAMAVLTIVGNLIYAVEPVIVDIIDYIGAPLTFVAGGTVVFLSGYALKKTSLTLFTQNKLEGTASTTAADAQGSRYGLIFFFGLVLGVATTVLFNLFPSMLQEGLYDLWPNSSGKLMLVGILVVSALISWPMSNKVNDAGLEKSFWLSFAVVMATMILMFFTSDFMLLIAVVLPFTIGFTALSVSALPLAMQQAADKEKVFCVGIFFAGVALPEGLLAALQAL